MAASQYIRDRNGSDSGSYLRGTPLFLKKCLTLLLATVETSRPRGTTQHPTMHKTTKNHSTQYVNMSAARGQENMTHSEAKIRCIPTEGLMVNHRLQGQAQSPTLPSLTCAGITLPSSQDGEIESQDIHE